MEGIFQPTHLIFILLIVLIIFGPGKLPELGRGLGKGIREFKEAMKGGLSGDAKSGTAAQPAPAVEQKAEPAVKTEAPGEAAKTEKTSA